MCEFLFAPNWHGGFAPTRRGDFLAPPGRGDGGQKPIFSVGENRFLKCEKTTRGRALWTPPSDKKCRLGRRNGGIPCSPLFAAAVPPNMRDFYVYRFLSLDSGRPTQVPRGTSCGSRREAGSFKFAPYEPASPLEEQQVQGAALALFSPMKPRFFLAEKMGVSMDQPSSWL